MLRTFMIAVSLSACWLSPGALGQGPDWHGAQAAQLTPPGARVVVLIFAATDCPISRRYVPEVARLEEEFRAQGAVFRWVFANPGDTAEVVRQHALDYSIRASTVIDSRQELVRLAHVTVTPEAAVFAVDHGALREAYHGRIDDLYYAFGRARPAATQHDLEDAIKAVLAGKQPHPAAHGPVGCSIVPLSMVALAKP